MATDFVVGEDFDLTPAIKTQVEEKLAQLHEILHKDTPISVFLSKSGDHTFKVTLSLREDGRDLVASEEGDDFYVILNRAKQHLFRRVTDLHKKQISARHA